MAQQKSSSDDSSPERGGEPKPERSEAGAPEGAGPQAEESSGKNQGPSSSSTPDFPSVPDSPSEMRGEVGKAPPDGELLNRRSLMILLAALAVILYPIFKLFLVPVVVATAFTTLFYPLYRWYLRKLKGRRGPASLACCLTLLLGLLVPTYILVHMVALQTIDFYNIAEPRVRELLSDTGREGLLQRIGESRFFEFLRINEIDWKASLQEGIKSLGKLATSVINRTSVGLLGMLANVGVMVFTMFYFFMDGDGLVGKLRYLSPLRRDYEDMLVGRFLSISRATVRGTLLVGLAQGTVGGVTLLIFGVRTWLLWGFVMVLLSIVPIIGAWLVLIPAAIIMAMSGAVWKALGIILVSTLVVSNIDNLLRPRLVGQDAKLHDLLIFFSTLGGIAVFGVMGFIVGPVIAALFVTVVEIYGVEFEPELTSPYTSPPAGGEPSHSRGSPGTGVANET